MLVFLMLLLQAGVATTPTSTPQAGSPWAPTTWSTEVVTTLITIAASAAGAIWGWLRERGKRQEAEKKVSESTHKLQQAEKSAASAAKFMEMTLLERFGFKVGCATYKAEIIDMDGSCKMNWEWQGIQITRQNMTLSSIPAMVWYSAPQAKITQYPTLTKWTFSRPVSLRHLLRKDAQCEFLFEITGGMAYEDDDLAYEYKAEVFNGFIMTREEVAEFFQAYPKEYFCVDVVIPMDKIELEVIFPEGFLVEANPGVFMGSVLAEGLMHGEELRRIEPGFRKTNLGAQLTVENPLLGFRYLIYWVPPPKKTVDALRGSNVSSPLREGGN